ncbi:MAG: polyphosphate polymerase domain-containing protein [Bifidobacteriaceae bacterium]|jgi:SPX domain protein involved in polyphosphate accumulation|nr:polyphosphate polymerase domain-containing protein [Bifidobacteriaceae bacterium]
MAIEVFNRYENKHLVNREQQEQLLSDLQAKMELDKHNPNGKAYKIYNLYYDTSDNNLIRRSLEKPRYKEKVRVRAYGVVAGDDMVFVEIKKKYDGLVNKRRTKMTLSDAKQFLENAEIELQTYMNPQVVNELAEIIGRRKLRPAINIAYERTALIDPRDSDLRVSFDHAIATRRHDVGLDKEAVGEYLLPDDQYVMEVKTRHAMPLWLAELLGKHHVRAVSFSKYGREYIKKLKEEHV